MRRDSEGTFTPAGGADYTRARERGWSDSGLIETFEPMVSEPRRDRLQQVLARRLDSVTVVMDAPHDPHNGAAIIRTCDALGVQRVHVIARVEPFLASRVVTKGSEQWVDVVTHESPDVALVALRAAKYTLVGTHPEGPLTPADLAGVQRLALVFGNEHDGICEELTLAVDRTVRIPMRGFVESLNVSVSAAILLARATEGRSGDLAAAERNSLYARWLLQSVSRSAEIADSLAPR